MSAPLVFMDTETTGLSLDDDIWEFAAIRRDPDGTQTELHLFIEHDRAKCAKLPESFREDHQRRYDSAAEVETAVAVKRITELFHGPTCGAPKPHVVGAVPSFDTERLLTLVRRHQYSPDLPWHYHLVDVENLAVGFLAAARYAPSYGPTPVPDLTLPWDSNSLSRTVGVDPYLFERHTAMGDVRWAMAIYDAVMGGAR